MHLPDWIAHPEEWEGFVLVAVIVLIGIYGLLRMTLSGARALGRSVLPPKTFKRVLVPATAVSGYSEAAIRLACRLAGTVAGPAARILLVYIIEVPRTLALDAPMPTEEGEANRALTQAAEQVKRQGLQAATQVRKSRTTLDETLRAIQEEKADLTVVTIPPDPRNAGTPYSSLALTNEMTRRAACEVVFARTDAR